MNPDWADAIAALKRVGARFLAVGAHAVAVHGVPRGTQDLDLWVEPTEENAKLVWQALTDFGAPLVAIGVTLDDLSRPDRVVQLGVPPRRIDVMTSISGVPRFGDAWERRVEAVVDGVAVPVLGREDLVANKRASGRTKDRADLEVLAPSQKRNRKSSR